MKKVAIFTYSLGGGGAEKAALELALGLKSDYEVEIVTLSPLQKYDSAGIKVASLSSHDLESSAFSKLMSLFRLAAIFASYCKKNQVDVVVAFLSRPIIISALSKFLNPTVRVIATEHTTLSNYYGNTLAERVLKRLLSLSYKIVNAVAAVSEGIKEDLSKNFNIAPDKIKVAYNPIDVQKIEAMSKERVKKEEGFVFITAGRLVESKNYPFLFEAFKGLPSFCKLLVLGGGELESELKFLAVEMGLFERIKFLGFCENPYKYFAASDCFVMSSRLEGLPTVLIEALACGLPVISTDCKSGPREILGGGKEMLISGLERARFGLLASLDNPRFLSLAMRKIIEDDGLRDEYRRNAKARAGFFSKEKSFETYKKLIEGDVS